MDFPDVGDEIVDGVTNAVPHAEGAFPDLPPPPPGGKVEDEEPEPEPQKRRFPKAIVVSSVVIALALVAGLGVFAARSWFTGPDPCAASTVESPRFGYCLAAPGWELANVTMDTELPYDELRHPADASTVRIVAIDLLQGQGLFDVVSDARDQATEDGFDVGRIVRRRVAGVEAAQWDLTPTAEDETQRRREVVFVREGSAWRVQLQTNVDGFEVRTSDLEEILDTWAFR
jgi:hypothetical protein